MTDAGFAIDHGTLDLEFVINMQTHQTARLYVQQSESVLLTPQVSRLERIKEMSNYVRPLLLPLHFSLKVSMSQ